MVGLGVALLSFAGADLAQWQATGVPTVAVMPDPVDPGEPYTDAVKRTLTALAP